MLCASSIDAMLKWKGLKDGSLYSRIETAASLHLITNDMGLWAHEVRLDANEERHADDGSALPSEADAKRALDFTKALGMFLFALPAMVERGRNPANGTTVPGETKPSDVSPPAPIHTLPKR
jgi:hypothetical protein